MKGAMQNEAKLITCSITYYSTQCIKSRARAYSLPFDKSQPSGISFMNIIVEFEKRKMAEVDLMDEMAIMMHKVT